MVIFATEYRTFTLEQDAQGNLYVMFGDEYCVPASEFLQLESFLDLQPSLREKWVRDSL